MNLISGRTSRRQDTLRRYRLQEAPGAADAALDGLARLAARVIGVPRAFVALFDDNRHWVQAGFGPAAPGESALIEQVLRGESALIIPDLAADSARSGEGFFAGVPLRTEDGIVLGAVAVLDPIARELPPESLQDLHAVGDQVMVLLDSRRAAEELRASEERQRQTRRLEAIGRIAAGVAHDFNNTLTAILGFSEVLLDRMGPDHAFAPETGEIRQAALRAADMTRHLLAFSRKQLLQPKVLQLNDAVAEQGPLLRRLLGEDIELVVDGGAGLDPVKIDPTQLHQVIMNLAVNARDAMPEGGRITIRTRSVVHDGDAGIKPGRYALLSVADTGHGMDEETLSHVFEPFFTTKEGGTGLGLATTYGIIRQSGGHVRILSRVGWGTTFHIYLPTTAEGPAAAAPAARKAVSGTGTILVAEDEGGIRALIRAVLTKAGYRVLLAASGEEAMQVAADHEGSIDLLLSDVVMPGMGGAEVADRLSRLRPATKVLMMSGYADSVLVRQRITDQGRPILPKPFAVDALLQEVRRALEVAER